MIVDLYNNIIVPYWEKKNTVINYNPSLAKKVTEQKYS